MGSRNVLQLLEKSSRSSMFVNFCTCIFSAIKHNTYHVQNNGSITHVLDVFKNPANKTIFFIIFSKNSLHITPSIKHSLKRVSIILVGLLHTIGGNLFLRRESKFTLFHQNDNTKKKYHLYAQSFYK